MVVKNIKVGTSGEEYLVSEEKLNDRYKRDEAYWAGVSHAGREWVPMIPVGKVTGAEYTGDTVTFEAPWGGEMPLENGDFLVTPYPLGDNYEDDIYRIEKDAFHATYL